MTRVLAIDYGKKRCGLAVTDELRLIASGLDYVLTKDLISYLKSYLSVNEVSCFVLGEPRQINGEHSETWPSIQNLAGRLKNEFGREVQFQDERFTSKLAQRSLIESGVPRMKRREKGLVDQVSATIILQSWLYSQKSISTQ